MSASSSMDQVIVNTIRTLSMDAIQKANSGHPGAPMGLAPVAHTLYSRLLNFNPGNPDWPNRDRFVLSAGHASMMLYSCLLLNGYDISLDDIKKFRQLDSITAGHPEYGAVPGVEMTTGPLGQGLATSVGMAIAEKWLAEYFNRPGHQIVDYSIFALGGDGCLMEGISYEAASLAGHLTLDNLIWIYDSNSITIEGSTDLAVSENTQKRFEACGWSVQHLKDANDIKGLEAMLFSARQTKGKPSLIIVDSHIGYGSPAKQDSSSAHGSPLGEEEIKATKKVYGLNPDLTFYIPPELDDYKKDRIQYGMSLEKTWQDNFTAYAEEYPELSRTFGLILDGLLPDDLLSGLPQFPADTKGMATRASGGEVLNAVAEKLPWLVGGSADLAPSTNTLIKTSVDFSAKHRSGRNLRYGIREHSMGAVVNGLTLSGLRGFGATFLVFADYMRPAIRLAALMELPSLFIFTHDSIGVGEDGPTHQPIEHLASLRAIPNLDILRPADANECSVLWQHALKTKDRPCAFILSRQSLPTLGGEKLNSAEGAIKGGYVIQESELDPDIILIATGSEVHICIDAANHMRDDGVNVSVVSMPCTELFDRQSAEYRESVLPGDVKIRLAVEAGSSFGWSRYTLGSEENTVIGINHFGASAPANKLFERYGFTSRNIMEKALILLKKA